MLGLALYWKHISGCRRARWWKTGADSYPQARGGGVAIPYLGFLQEAFLPRCSRYERTPARTHIGLKHTFIFRACAIKEAVASDTSVNYVNKRLGRELC